MLCAHGCLCQPSLASRVSADAWQAVCVRFPQSTPLTVDTCEECTRQKGEDKAAGQASKRQRQQTDSVLRRLLAPASDESRPPELPARGEAQTLLLIDGDWMRQLRRVRRREASHSPALKQPRPGPPPPQSLTAGARVDRSGSPRPEEGHQGAQCLPPEEEQALSHQQETALVPH